MAASSNCSISSSNLRSRRTQLIFIPSLLFFSLFFLLNYSPLTSSDYSFTYSRFLFPALSSVSTASFQNGSGLVLATQKITLPEESGSSLETHLSPDKISPVSPRSDQSKTGLGLETHLAPDKISPVSPRSDQSETGSGLGHLDPEKIVAVPRSGQSQNGSGLTSAPVFSTSVNDGKTGSGQEPGKNPGSCDIYDGKWVLDEESDPLYPPGSCPYLDYAFNCYNNGRSDLGYLKYRWQPHGCNIPRFDGKMMLEILRGKRMVFVGDSLNRNMWESLVCALRMSLVDKRRVFEVSGKREFRTQGYYSFLFKDYNCTIDFISSPFLVQQWKWPKKKNRGGGRETLRLDMMQATTSKYENADFIIFNTAHWWTHYKTKAGKDYYQEGDVVYKKLSVEEAYTKALKTWAKWVDKNVNRKKTKVLFSGYSSTHFRGGQWNSGGNCDGETEPITNDKFLGAYPKMMQIFEGVMSKMKTPVVYLNISKMTGYRKDGHPSKFRQPGGEVRPGTRQDCSHWCLPGVPDTWNQLLFTHLLTTSNLSIRTH